MLNSVQNFSIGLSKSKINFGSNEREISRKLDPNEHHLMNCSYLFRPDADHPQEIMETMVKASLPAKKTEWKIWGCADMSSFLPTAINLQRNLGKDTYKRVFSDIELIDIDPDIVGRAQKGLIGLTKKDMSDADKLLGVNYKNYFTEAPEEGFFLDGEPRSVYNGRLYPHKAKEDLLEGVKIRQGDVREDIKKLPGPQPGVRRIFDFANSWYFMNKKDQVNLACDFSEKMQKGDILMIGRVERASNVPDALEQVGFINKPWSRNIFIKAQDLSKEHIEKARKYLVQVAEFMLR